MDSFTGTRPVSERHALDIDALERFLVTNLGGFAGPSLIGLIKEATHGFTVPLLTVAGILLFGSVAMLLLGDPSRAPSRKPAIAAA